MISKSDFRYNVCLLLVSVSLARAQDILNYGTCMTPNAEPGTCISLLHCTYIYNLLIKTPLLNADKKFLKQSQCGMDNSTVLVCCTNHDTQPQAEIAVISKRSFLPEPGDCASNVFTSRIYDGNVTKIDEYPWMARVIYNKSDNTTTFGCGASLISERYVLTAAHCIQGVPSSYTPIGIRLGEWNTTTNPDCEINASGYEICADPYIDVQIENIIVHPEYLVRSRDQYNDIALIRLLQTVIFSDYVRPICLPLKDSLRRSTFEGTVMDVAGWGWTEPGLGSKVKLKASIPVLPLDECRYKHGTFNINLQSSQICAGGLKGIDSCNGDSGGPLIGFDATNKFYFFIAGIVSYGATPCGLEGWPGVYTKVSYYIDWIKQNVY